MSQDGQRNSRTVCMDAAQKIASDMHYFEHTFGMKRASHAHIFFVFQAAVAQLEHNPSGVQQVSSSKFQDAGHRE